MITITDIINDTFYVSDKANPKKFNTEGTTTWKKFFDILLGKDLTMESIVNKLSYYDISIEEAEKMYDDPEELNFWVYDRYNDGSFILYTIFGNEGSKYGTYEIVVDEILNI